MAFESDAEIDIDDDVNTIGNILQQFNEYENCEIEVPDNNISIEDLEGLEEEVVGFRTPMIQFVDDCTTEVININTKTQTQIGNLCV